MKKILVLIVCVFMICVSVVDTSTIQATENEDSNVTEDLEKSKNVVNDINESKDEIKTANDDELLSKFTEESIVVTNIYNELIKLNKDENPAFNQYKDYDVLYQQNTGINTVESLLFNCELNDLLPINIKLGETKEIGNGYKVSVSILDNPASDASFIKEPKDFTIVAKVTLTNKSGQSVSINKNLNANVVQVVGKIINREAKYEFEKCLEIQDELNFQDIMDYLFQVHKSLKVQLFDGSIIDVTGCLGQAGGMGGPNGGFTVGIMGVYDLKYLLEGATVAQCFDTYMKGYLVDKDNNLIDTAGNIVVPFNNRELKSFPSNVNGIKLNAKVGTIPDSSVLHSKKRTDLNLDTQYVAYDMNVVCNGESIQPIGNVDLTIDIPNNLLNKKLGVYYMDEQGKLEELSSTINGTVVSFTTNHFSTYILMEEVEASVKPIAPVKPEEEAKPNNSVTSNKKESVKTGDNTMLLAYTSLFVVSLGILVVLVKKKALKNTYK